MPFFKEGRAANHTSYVYAVGTSLPMEEIAVHASNVHAVALDYPNNTKSWNRKGYDHTSPRSPVVKSCLHPTAQIGRPAVLSHPALLYPRSPVGREALLHGHSSREYPPDGLYNSGGRTLPPYAQLMGNRFCPTTWHQSPEHHHTDIPQEVKRTRPSALIGT